MNARTVFISASTVSFIKFFVFYPKGKIFVNPFLEHFLLIMGELTACSATELAWMNAENGPDGPLSAQPYGHILLPGKFHLESALKPSLFLNRAFPGIDHFYFKFRLIIQIKFPE